MFRHYFRLALLLLAVAMLFVACGDDENPIVDGDDEDEPFHAESDGFVLKIDGQEIYRQFQGTETGGITLKVGEELDVLTVFLDQNGGEFFPEDLEEGEDHEDEDEHEGEEAFGLGLTGYDTSIVEIRLHEEEEGEAHDETEKWVMEVIGLKAGQTQIDFQLLHGDHPDFTAALPIPVTVTP